MVTILALVAIAFLALALVFALAFPGVTHSVLLHRDLEETEQEVARFSYPQLQCFNIAPLIRG